MMRRISFVPFFETNDFYFKTDMIETQSQGCIYVWILVGGNSIRRDSSDLTWTIVVRFVNWSAGKGTLFLFLSLTHTHGRSLSFVPFLLFDTNHLPSWRCLSASLGKWVLYRTGNLLEKFIAETRDFPFVLVLETFCNIAIITSRLHLR